MRLPSISIIIPTYNVAPYIKKCLESVAAQTYKGAIECLIVDDCGQDDSILIAKDFVSHYEGHVSYRIVQRKKNGGLSAARNTGIREARGDYLYFLDSDDAIIPECICFLVETLDKHPEVECVFAGAKDGYDWMSYRHKDLPSYSNNPLWIQTAISCRYILNMTAWNRLIKRDFVVDNDLYFEEGYFHEDEMWSQALALKLTKVAICKQDTYSYLIRESGIVGREKSGDMFEKRMVAWNHMLSRIPKNAPTALLGCLFLTQNHEELTSAAHRKLHNQFLYKISQNAMSYPCLMMRLFLLLPECLRAMDITKRLLCRSFNPYTMYKKIIPVI